MLALVPLVLGAQLHLTGSGSSVIFQEDGDGTARLYAARPPHSLAVLLPLSTCLHLAQDCIMHRKNSDGELTLPP